MPPKVNLRRANSRTIIEWRSQFLNQSSSEGREVKEKTKGGRLIITSISRNRISADQVSRPKVSALHEYANTPKRTGETKIRFMGKVGNRVFYKGPRAVGSRDW